MAPRSRSVRRSGGGVSGGDMGAVGGIGIILMLSSASAPSRVPQVVWWYHVSSCIAASSFFFIFLGGGLHFILVLRGSTYLCDGNAAVELDKVVKVAE